MQMRQTQNADRPIPRDKLLTRTSFGVAFEQLRNEPVRLLRQARPGGTEPHLSFTPAFRGEQVQGLGGPYRALFTDFSKELVLSGLLIPCPNSQVNIGNNRDKFVLNPSRSSALDLAMYRFLGQLMGMAMRTGATLTLDLPPFVWKALVGEQVTAADLRDVDAALYECGLAFLSACTDEEEFNDCVVGETFTTVLSDRSRVALVPGGEHIPVRFETRERYIALVEQARLNESQHQSAAVHRGLMDMVPAALLSVLRWQDVELRVCGRRHIDVAMLKRHTQYSAGVDPNAPHISWFWQIINEMTQSERRRFLRFAVRCAWRRA